MKCFALRHGSESKQTALLKKSVVPKDCLYSDSLLGPTTPRDALDSPTITFIDIKSNRLEGTGYTEDFTVANSKACLSLLILLLLIPSDTGTAVYSTSLRFQ